MEDKITTLKLRRSTIKRLREFELHPRATHEEVIINLIEEKERRFEIDNQLKKEASKK